MKQSKAPLFVSLTVWQKHSNKIWKPENKYRSAVISEKKHDSASSTKNEVHFGIYFPKKRPGRNYNCRSALIRVPSVRQAAFASFGVPNVKNRTTESSVVRFRRTVLFRIAEAKRIPARMRFNLFVVTFARSTAYTALESLCLRIRRRQVCGTRIRPASDPADQASSRRRIRGRCPCL